MASPASKRGPVVLVTDSRDASANHQRPGISRVGTTNAISVDGILKYSSGDIPSAQQRTQPGAKRPQNHNRTPSGRHPLDPKLSGRLIIPQHVPSRTSKVSEKLVILPDANTIVEEDADDLKDDDDAAPPRDDQILPGKKLKGKTYAESLPKARRRDKIPRVTAYGTAQAYKLRATADFLKSKHAAKTKLYDDCLYVVYQLPLLPGIDGYRLQSSPVVKTPGGKSVLDEEMERIERGERHLGFSEETHHYAPDHTPSPVASPDRRRSTSPPAMQSSLSIGEVFVFSYGVVVFWNFSERQEKDILADLTFSTSETGITLSTRPLSEADFETEEFHFEYNPSIPRPRVMADMFTLRSHDHMIKLAISHAIAQSTKLSYFEERMERTMVEAQHVPRRLALTGRLGMKREEVVKILGALFQNRVDVNLSSNILDVPNFFWESEPTLNPLYSAVREYLEIKPRIQVLNERCRVFLDLAEILSDAVADKKMTYITWIIIILIIISILVTCSEVLIRFGILHNQNKVVGSNGDLESIHALAAVANSATAQISTKAAPLLGGVKPATMKGIARASLVTSWVLVGTSLL